MAETPIFVSHSRPDSTDTDVPNLYYTGSFEEVYDLLCAAAMGLPDTIRAEHGL